MIEPLRERRYSVEDVGDDPVGGIDVVLGDVFPDLVEAPPGLTILSNTYKLHMSSTYVVGVNETEEAHAQCR